MLIFVILLIVSVHFYPTSGINLTYIVKKGANTVYPSCIAEENVQYLGIGWIYPLPKTKEALPEKSTKYIPTISNSYGCNFSKYNKCNKFWQLKNWQIAENTTRNFDLILDERWDDFPIIFTSSESKEFEDRIEIQHTFELAFSVRSPNVEIFICEGWNPYNYPCYYINIGQLDIVLKKFPTTPKVIQNADNMDSYKAFSNIIFEEEWRNFILKFNSSTGVLELVDILVNRTVIQFTDTKPLKPLYFFPKSQNSSLWKIHHNNFLYTNVSQISRVGPTLGIPSKDLCVALYVATCENCAMTFLIANNNEKIILEEVPPTQNKWKLIKLKRENILDEKINIFIKTKLINNETINNTEHFWAIDDVRVCHENEVKVTFLKFNTNFTSDQDAEKLSCQVVEHAKWRPKQYVYTEIKGMPMINTSVTADSIILSWDPEYSLNPINYFIYYTANDICLTEPHNLRRIKSNGFIMTKNSDIEIKDLVPYTRYNITFTSLLHEKDTLLFATTEETDVPTPEELPDKVQIQVTDNSAFISWEKIDCRSIYGHIFYSIKLTDYANNTKKIIKNQTENTIEITNLEPYSNYSVEISTVRKYKQLENQNYGMVFNFTTMPGTPPAINNLEIYATDEDSLFLRYDVPDNPRGVPVYLQITRCNPVSLKCKSTVQPIEKCKVWPEKYCIDVKNLIPNQKYNLKISIKNDYTHTFGKETHIEGFTGEKVPSPPTNITYKIVDCKEGLDYCHLNISWLHPYYQNGSITAFDIVLNSTDNNVSKNIKEVLRTGKIYQPKYEHQIKFIPYSSHYELYIQSVNTKYKSEYANIHIKTADVGDFIDQSPKLLEKTDNHAVFKVPPVDSRLESYNLTVIVQDYDKEKKISKDLLDSKDISQHLCLTFGNTWISQMISVTNSTTNITVGTDSETNQYLQPDTSYCFTFIVTNIYKNSSHDVVYHEKLHTNNATIMADNVVKSSQHHLWGLLVLLLLIPVALLTYKLITKKRRRRPNKTGENHENVYESLPFEDCDETAVSNQTYDQLLHK